MKGNGAAAGRVPAGGKDWLRRDVRGSQSSICQGDGRETDLIATHDRLFDGFPGGQREALVSEDLPQGNYTLTV